MSKDGGKAPEKMAKAMCRGCNKRIAQRTDGSWTHTAKHGISHYPQMGPVEPRR